MSELLKNIKTMLDVAIASENYTMKIYVNLIKAYEELGDEKFRDVAGLYKPNIYLFIRDIKNHMEEIDKIKFPIDLRIADIDKEEMQKKINKWKESIKKIPEKDEYSLEGIETWHISQYEMNPNYPDIHRQLFRDEAKKLIASGFDLAFNTDKGTGSIRTTDNGFRIELWQYMKKTEIGEHTLDDVLDWLIHFYETN